MITSEDKIRFKITYDINELAKRLTTHRKREDKIVLTNGVYDLLHRGHIYNLCASKDLGDILVVVVNSDVPSRGLKGDGRPIQNESERSFTVASLECVDYVLVWKGDDGDSTTIRKVLSTLVPDIWTKGSDRTLETLDQKERRVAEGLNIGIEFIPRMENLSTTGILEKIIDLFIEKKRG